VLPALNQATSIKNFDTIHSLNLKMTQKSHQVKLRLARLLYQGEIKCMCTAATGKLMYKLPIKSCLPSTHCVKMDVPVGISSYVQKEPTSKQQEKLSRHTLQSCLTTNWAGQIGKFPPPAHHSLLCQLHCTPPKYRTVSRLKLHRPFQQQHSSKDVALLKLHQAPRLRNKHPHQECSAICKSNRLQNRQLSLSCKSA